ncbi:ABC transporter ATP-binding protein [Desulfobotulus sp.]|uniref:ABC transporter ATP-binding protein n=1 Tax=Desulfobotulus sp. TaxID=1940337 RepID=UPI002A367BD1|nr:ABC transporter ATP-binding protein [Desulfobotulus sp.]MDY0163519.1 ABC transporter ATP-binding protein [Desulfobotulus sp.]
MSDSSQKFFLRQIAGAPRRIGLACLLSVFSGFAAMIPFLVVHRVLLHLLSGELHSAPLGLLLPLAGVAAAAVVCRHLFFYGSLVFSHMAAFDILLALRREMAAHLGQLPMGFFDRNRTGIIKKTVTEDVEQMELFIAHHLPDFVTALVVPLVLLVFQFTIHPLMGLAAFLPLPFALWLQIRIRRRILAEGMIAGYHASLVAMNQVIVEFVRGMEVIRIFNRSRDVFQRLRDAVLDFRDQVHAVTEVSAPAWGFFVVSVNAAVFCLVPMGLVLHDAGRLDTADFLLCLMIGAGYMAPVMKIALMAGLFERIREGVRQMDRIFKEPVLPDPDVGYRPRSASVSFTEVSFSYGDRLALDRVNFELPSGSITALVGPSGAGKTTIAQLLCRMQDPDAGSIRIGGVDLREMTWSELTRHISCVFQETMIFSGTVMENLRLGRPGATEAEVFAASQAARCEDFVLKLPEGYHTRVGNGGVHLSGGERQRINLARVILRDAPVVVLDEATAFADPENELAIQEALSHLMAEKTVVIIAHRLVTIMNCDRILVVEAGRLVEAGVHGTLLAVGGRYAAMWRACSQASDWVLGGEAAHA